MDQRTKRSVEEMMATFKSLRIPSFAEAYRVVASNYPGVDESEAINFVRGMVAGLSLSGLPDNEIELRMFYAATLPDHPNKNLVSAGMAYYGLVIAQNAIENAS